MSESPRESGRQDQAWPDVDETRDDAATLERADETLEAPFPWPPSEHDSIPAAFARTWQGAALAPASFFRRMPAAGALGPALLYYLPLGILIAGVDVLIWYVRGSTEQDVTLPFGMDAAAMDPFVSFLLSPLILLLSLFVSAGVTHVLLKLFGGANRDFVFTTRVFAFAYSPQIVSVIPVVGTVAGMIWMIVVGIIGLREGHRTTTGRAAAAVLIPVVIALFMIAVAAFITAATGLLTEG